MVEIFSIPSVTGHPAYRLQSLSQSNQHNALQACGVLCQLLIHECCQSVAMLTPLAASLAALPNFICNSIWTRVINQWTAPFVNFYHIGQCKLPRKWQEWWEMLARYSGTAWCRGKPHLGSKSVAVAIGSKWLHQSLLTSDIFIRRWLSAIPCMISGI